MNGALANEWRAFALAVQFLTRVPIDPGQDYSERRFAASVRYLALVGSLIGASCAAVFWFLLFWFPVPVALLLALAAGLAVTGAFHEDGLADTFDGIGASAGDRERALEIMRDSRLGTYGTAALIMALALKYAALLTLPPITIGTALIAGHGLSRLSSVIAMQTGSYVREAGTGTPLAGRLGAVGWCVTGLVGLLLVAGLAVSATPATALSGLAGLGIGHMAMRLYYERRLKGYTGDTLGAVQQASEAGLYLGLAAWA